MEKSLHEALVDVRRGRDGHLYFLYGAGDGYAGEMLAQQLQNTGTGAGSGREIVRRSLLTEEFGHILAEADTGGLFAEPAIVLCADFEYPTTNKAHGAGGAAAEDVEWLLAHPPFCPLILCAAGEKLDERKKAVKQMRASPSLTVINAAKHSREQWRFLARDLVGSDAGVTAPQLERILARCGASLANLASEAQKLRLYLATNDRISDETLNLLVADSSRADIFEVVRLTVAHRFVEAYQLYLKLAGQESLFAFFALLARQYRLIARVQDDPHQPDNALASLLGVHPYAIKVAREQARAVPAGVAKQELVTIADLEYAVKSGRWSERTALDLWFLRHIATA
ncbi:MAG: DNA polymerase III subunit delta [Bacilli bacterium]